MIRMRYIGIALCAVIAVCVGCAVAFAQQSTADNDNFFKGIELLTGFGTSDTSFQGKYQMIPVFVDFDFNIKTLPLLKKYLPGMLEFVLEPFAFGVFKPDSNAEAGINFLLKIGFLPETSRFQPYFKGGVGLLYMSQHLLEQSTQFNFNEPASLGFHYFFQENVALTLEYRFRHLSNAGMKSPNHGVNTHFALCGIAYKF